MRICAEQHLLHQNRQLEQAKEIYKSVLIMVGRRKPPVPAELAGAIVGIIFFMRSTEYQSVTLSFSNDNHYIGI